MPAQPPETPKPAPVPEVEPRPIEPRPIEQKPVEPKPAPPEVRKPVPRPKPRPPARPLAKTPQPVAEPAPEPAPAPAPAPVVAPPPQAQPPVSAAPLPAPAAPRAAAGPDAASLVAQYRAAIMLQAARYKRYPRFARDNGWEGKVDVRMEIGADGSIASLRVVRGTGYSILDQQALDMVRRAKPDAAIPGGLRGKAFGIDVPVIFSLRDADG